MTEFANIDKYPFTIRPLSDEDGGGFLIECPDASTKVIPTTG